METKLQRLNRNREETSRKRAAERDARDEGRPIRSRAREDWINNKVLQEEFRVFDDIPTPSDFVPPPARGPRVYRPSSKTNEWAWYSDTDSDGPNMDKYYSDLVLRKRTEERQRTSTGVGSSQPTTIHRPVLISSDSDSDYEAEAGAAAAPVPRRLVRSVMHKGLRKHMELPKRK
jgi:hypothetical protein